MADKKTDMRKRKLGEVLLDAGVINQGQLDEALALQRRTKRRLGRVFVELGYVDENELCSIISKQLKIPMVDFSCTGIEEEALSKVSEEQAREKVMLPVRIVGGELTLALANPLDWMTVQEVEFSAGMRVNVAIAPESAILRAIDRVFGDGEIAEDASAGLPDMEELDVSRISIEGFGTNIDSLYRAAEFPPVVQTFSKFLSDAVRAGASDLHLEPRHKYVQVRIRVDGTLRNSIRYPLRIHEALTARAKAIAKLDLANRTMPQEGTNRIALGGRDINIRVSTLPSVRGESVIVSIIEKIRPVLEIGRLGLEPEMRRRVSALLHRGQGLVILAGLRGSGRRTTLYSLLQMAESDSISIVCIGTSSGYSLEKVKDIRLNEAAGFTLPIAIRSALRHDPDIIGTGELKDKESASAAIEAAMNGKLAISIIEAPDAASALAKLSSMGITPYALRSSVSGVLAQKLLRGICIDCREQLDSSTLTAIKDLPHLENAFTGTGCSKCGGTGLRGRVAVFELMSMDHNILRVLSDDVLITEHSIRAASVRSGFGTMFEDAWTKTSSGLLTVDEALSLLPSSK